MRLRLVQSVLEALTSAEARYDACRDVDLLSWVLWIDTDTALAHFGEESAETGESELITLLESGGDEVNVCFDDLFALLLGNLQLFYEVFYEIALLEFVHTCTCSRKRE